MAKLHPAAVSRAIQALGLLGYDPEEAREIVEAAVTAYQDEIKRPAASGELEQKPGSAAARRPSPTDWDDEDDLDEE